MRAYEEFCVHARLESRTLDAWVAAGWLIPIAIGLNPSFSEADLARAQLIRDLGQDLGVNEDGIGVILDLIDQIHGLRHSLKSLSAALAVLPPDARATIQQELGAREK
ncbi:MAG: chaperone modulator CbpM [Acetobacteraceae bacterium]